MPDRNTKGGRRDLVLLSLIYDTGAKVQEIADVRVADVRLHPPATVKLTGKGNRTRIVPLSEAKKLFPECFPNTISPHVLRHYGESSKMVSDCA